MAAGPSSGFLWFTTGENPSVGCSACDLLLLVYSGEKTEYGCLLWCQAGMLAGQIIGVAGGVFTAPQEFRRPPRRSVGFPDTVGVPDTSSF